jgi:hypothetical protein
MPLRIKSASAARFEGHIYITGRVTGLLAFNYALNLYNYINVGLPFYKNKVVVDSQSILIVTNTEVLTICGKTWLEKQRTAVIC